MAGFNSPLWTISAVVVGALLSYVLTVVRERANWRRENSDKLVQHRVEAYSNYADALHRLLAVTFRLAAGRGLEALAQPLVPDEAGLALLAAAESERTARWQRLLLLADPATIQAARQWHEHVWMMTWFVRGEADEHVQWKSIISAARDARDQFYNQARKSLQIDGSLPPYSKVRGGRTLLEWMNREVEPQATAEEPA